MIVAASSVAVAGGGCPACQGGTAGAQLAWEEGIKSWVGEDSAAPPVQPERTASPQGSFAEILVPGSAIGDADIVLDVRADGAEYIEGAINVPYTRFLTQTGSLRTVEEMAQVMGDSGISESDSVVLFGTDPSQVAYVYWVLKYLGHPQVRILDESLEDWKADGRPVTSQMATLPVKDYNAVPCPELLATSDDLNSGQVQIVDARSMTEFGMGSLLGAVNIPAAAAVSDGRIKDQAALEKILSFLNRDKPVVVYADSAQQGSAVWLALTLLGYDARLYPGQG